MELTRTLKATNHFSRNSFAYTFGVLVVAIGICLFGYLYTYGFVYGMDYYSTEFSTYWLPLLYGELIVLGGGCIVSSVYFFMTRPSVNELTWLTATEELNLYWRLLGIFAVMSVWAGFAGSLAIESDAAWHQVTIRDTDFTPTHIIIFYFALPALTAMLIPSFIWAHTRIPAFAGRISVPFLAIVCGILMIMPNYGFNEWGHTFFYAEELFAAPIHYGFVFLGWSLFFLVPLSMQLIGQMSRLISASANELE